MSTIPSRRVVNVGADLLADAVADQAVAGHPGRLAPADARHRGRPRRPWRPTRCARTANERALAADARRHRDPGRRRARRPRCSGCEPRRVPARRPADRLGARLRPAARRADGRRRARGPGRRPRGRRPRSSSPAPASPSSPATTAPPSARWPAWSRRRCGCSCWRTPPPAGVPTARSTRASARCCATAPTAPRCSTRLRWMGDVLGPLLQQAVPRDRARSTSPASSPRCCRWATRPTTATGPAP